MFSWFFFSVASLILFGIAIALYKLPSAKKVSSSATTFWMIVFNFLFALIVFHNFIGDIDSTVLLYGAAWGVSFALIASLQMYALKHVDTNVLFPVTTTLSLVIAVGLGLVLFAETLSLLQQAGIILATLTIYLFLYKGGKFQFSSHLLLVGIGVLFLSVFGKIILKFGVDAVEIEPLQISQYLSAAIFALLMSLLLNRSDMKNMVSASVIKSGLIISVPSFLGGWALLVALTKGPFSLITALHSSYIFATAIFAYLFFGENLTKKKVLLLLLALLAIFLIRLG